MKRRFHAYHALVIIHLMVYVLMVSDIILYAQRVFSGDGRYMLFRYSVITFSFISSMILLIFAFFRIPRTAEVFSFLAFGVLSLFMRIMIPYEYPIIFMLWNTFAIIYFSRCRFPLWYIVLSYSVLYLSVFLVGLPPSNLRLWHSLILGETFPYSCPAILVLTISFGLFAYGDRLKSASYESLKNDLTGERSVNKQLTDFNSDLQNYIKQYGDEAAFAERNRITREMHDANGYHFTNIMALSNAAISSGNQEWPVIEEILQQILQQSRQGLIDSRRVLHELRDTFEITHRASIYTEINSIIRIFTACTQIHIDISWGNLPSDFKEGYIVAICRIIQECLVNSAKHGHATEIHISFWMQKDNTLILHIEDNGQGSGKIVKGIGLSGMEERLKPYGGWLEYSSSPYGFVVTAYLPMEKDASI